MFKKIICISMLIMLIFATIPLSNISVHGHGSTNKPNYLIITTEEFKSSFQNYTAGGVVSEVKTLTEIATELELDKEGAEIKPEEIRTYINNTYNNESWDLTYVLLGGDADIIPVVKMYYETNIPGMAGQYYIPADLYYGCLTGPFNGNKNNRSGETDDGIDGGDVNFSAQVYVGRACVNNKQEVINFIQKTEKYVNNVYEEKEYLNNILGVGQKLTGTEFGGYRYVDPILELLPTGNEFGYNVTRYYEEVVGAGNFDWQEVAKEINNGINFLIHCGHGYVDHTMNNWFTDDIDNALNNREMPFFMYSFACSIGKFTSDSWAEYMGPKSQNGAFALMVNSAPAMSVGMDEFAERFWTNAQTKPLGQALAEAKSSFYNSFRDDDPGCVRRMVLFSMNLLGCPAIVLADPPIPSIKPPTANFTIEPSQPAVDETVFFNCTSYVNETTNREIINWTWRVTFNSSDNDDENYAANPDCPDGDTNTEGFFNYNENFTHIFDKKGYYDVSLTVTDNAGQNDTKTETSVLKVCHTSYLYSNGSLLTNPESTSASSWSTSFTELPSFVFILYPPSDDPEDGDSNSSSESGSSDNNNNYNPVTITYLYPEETVSVDENETIEFTVEVENGSGDNYLILDFGDGDTYSNQMGWSATISHIYVEAGIYYPDIEVHDLNEYIYDSKYGFSTIAVSQSNNNPI